MGNVIAIGLTPSRTGIVIGPLLNAQLRHMSVHAAWRHKLSLFWPQTHLFHIYIMKTTSCVVHLEYTIL